jgi:hypothetical protein
LVYFEKRETRMKIKQSHCWDAEEITVVHVRCPYCQKHLDIEVITIGAEQGDKMICYLCSREFLLGKENI